jgi:23S rRNA (guanosine2251-2'-O)-methyltransferase
MHKLTVIVHDVRSTYNVGSILRSADGFNVSQVYLTGYTPYPKEVHDDRLPHVKDKVGRQIHKTALGAEDSVDWRHETDINKAINQLKAEGYLIAALEQSSCAKPLNQFTPKKSTALIVGNEVNGLSQEILQLADIHLEIPMQGVKESFNVAVAAGIAMYHLMLSGQKT